MTDTLRKLGLLIGSVLLSILVAEGILRLGTDPHFLEGEPVDGFEWMKLDPVIGWKNCNQHWGEDYDKQERMDWTRANVNSLGFRGPELSRAKPSGQKRIVLIGDSGTFGVMNVGKVDASATKRPDTSCDSPISPTTEALGSRPIAALASW